MKNFLSLASVQIISAISGILIIPMLINRLGIAEFGVFSIMLSIATMVQLVIDFGFGLSGVRQVSIRIFNKSSILEYLVSTLVIKTCFFIMLSWLLVVSQVYYNANASYLAFLIFILSAVFQVNFYYKAFEEMWVITLSTLVQRFITLLFLIFIPTENLLAIVVVYCLPYLLGNFMLFIFAFIRHYRECVSLTQVKIKNDLVDSYQVFVGVFGSALYRYLTIPLFALFMSVDVVGFYSATEKILRGIQGIFNSAADAVYPILCKESLRNSRIIVSGYIIFSISIVVMLGLSFLISVFGDAFGIVSVSNGYSSLIYLSLSFAFSIGTLNYFFGVSFYLSKGYQLDFSRIVFLSGTISILFIVVSGWAEFEKAVLTAPFVSELIIIILIMKGRCVK